MAKRLFSVVIALLLIVGTALPCFAEEATDTEEKKSSLSISELTGNDRFDYSDYLEGKEGENATSPIYLDFNNLTQGTIEAYEGKENAVAVKANAEDAVFKVNVENAGFYTIGISYCAVKATANNIVTNLKVDGENPFESLSNAYLPRLFVNTEDRITDKLGNEFSPEQVEVIQYSEFVFYDDTGSYVDPYRFYFSAGEHTVSFGMVQGEYYIEKVILGVPEVVEKYKDIEKKSGAENYSGDPIYIEGEDAYIKNSNSIAPSYDASSASVSPSNATKSVINFIGGENWQGAGDELKWEVDIEKSGYYNMGFFFRQSYVLNGNSYRWLKIDGKTPFEEAKKVKFGYEMNWEFMTFSDEDSGTPFLFYLEEGKHIISLSVTMGDWADISRRINEYITAIGSFYVDITLITGDTVDANRDYDLFNQIPQYNERLEAFRDGLTQITKEIEEIAKKKGGTYVSTINNMVQTIDGMLDNPYTAQNYVSNYYSNYCSLSTVMQDMADLPLDIDRIVLYSPDDEEPDLKVSFIESSWFGIKRFINSFNDQYKASSESTKKADKVLTLWNNWGRDETRILQTLIQSNFTPTTGIEVDLKIVNTSIVQGIASNNVPDCQLWVQRDTPVNLAMRGVYHNLREFEDCDEVLERFNDGAEIPYQYKDGLYGLPDTQGFFVLMYRTDVFKKLDLEVPTTWDEFIEVSSVIQRNNLNVSLPYVAISSDQLAQGGIGSLSLFPTLLSQHGLSFYTDDLRKTTLTEPETVDVFNQWTDFYTEYKMPTTIDFNTRFRVGTAPMGIVSYLTVCVTQQTSPEIAGCWNIAPIPGTVQEDGTINNAVSGSGTAAVILDPIPDENKENAWEFLKWWTSAEIQLRFNSNVEAILGVTSRRAASNREAVINMQWDPQMLETILSQWDMVEEVPEVPGSYYSSRAVDQSFWNVMNANENPKEMLLKWGKIADAELERKGAQYGY